jgi:hypothetical protein
LPDVVQRRINVDIADLHGAEYPWAMAYYRTIFSGWFFALRAVLSDVWIGTAPVNGRTCKAAQMRSMGASGCF